MNTPEAADHGIQQIAGRHICLPEAADCYGSLFNREALCFERAVAGEVGYEAIGGTASERNTPKA